MPPRKAKPRAPKRPPAKRKPAKRKPAKRKPTPRQRKIARAEKLASAWYERERERPDEDEDRDMPTYPWDRDEGWEPEGGWQGDDLADEVSYMTHEEKIDFFEYLAEQLDTTVHELFEMAGSP